jgi:hypothetical protein
MLRFQGPLLLLMVACMMTALLKTQGCSGTRQRQLARPRLSLTKRFEFDPATTWRRRRRDEISILSAMERRYLLDLLAQIEAGTGTLSDELRISGRRMSRTGACRPARPLALLLRRGLIVVTNENGNVRAVITRGEWKNPGLTPRPCEAWAILEGERSRGVDSQTGGEVRLGRDTVI